MTITVRCPSLEKQRIEETDEQVLVHLGPKQLLEAEVGVGVDVAFLEERGHETSLLRIFSVQKYLFPSESTNISVIFLPNTLVLLTKKEHIGTKCNKQRLESE